MRYLSTRGGSCQHASYAILHGIAPGGGLYVPSELPALSRAQIEALADVPYARRAAFTLALLLNDFDASALEDMTQAAYAGFDHPAAAPVRTLDDDTHVLELFHGPTLAFKDMALQILPRLMTASAARQGEGRQIAVLTATSGDTGKAALSGFEDVPGASVTVFYPLGGVSRMQELQMLTAGGGNTRVIGVRGNFDDAQAGVKRLFTDPSFIAQMDARGRVMSSANSINLGRLAPQVAYYLSACADLLRAGVVNWQSGLVACVPTGNFGDILAAWYAHRMGAPIRRLLCASNANSVLTGFFRTGVYDRRLPLHKTISPSMDILVSSNLERYLYDLLDGDPARVSACMRALSDEGVYDVGADSLARMRQAFYAGWADDSATRQEIARVFARCGYVLDPHTAVASRVLADYRAQTGDDAPALIIATASPYKFAPDVLRALGEDCPDAFDAARRLSDISRTPVPAPIAELSARPVLHSRTCDVDGMRQAVLDALG